MDRLSEIRARCEAATPGPWEVKVKGNTVESHQVMSPGNGPICSAISPKTKNAQFIAHAREDIPYLLEEVKQARAERDHIKLSNDGLCVSHDNLYARLREATARAKKAEAERDTYKVSLQNMRFAYVNKNIPPHQFEVEALKETDALIGKLEGA